MLVGPGPSLILAGSFKMDVAFSGNVPGGAVGFV